MHKHACAWRACSQCQIRMQHAAAVHARPCMCARRYVRTKGSAPYMVAMLAQQEVVDEQGQVSAAAAAAQRVGTPACQRPLRVHMHA